MRRTLLMIPHEIAGLPVFGFGWLLIALAVGLVVRIVVAKRRGQTIGDVVRTEGMVWAMAVAAVTIVLPMVELKNLDGEPVGMALRGYGAMLLLAVGSAVSLAAFRAKRAGMNPDLIYAMAPWAFFGGIFGARLFFVTQYRDQFIGETTFETIGNMLKFTEGGLVVYGAFIGGSLAVTYFLFRHHLPVLKFGDVIVPCMFLGLFFGRIGCLMNGCCYGGRCEEGPTALHFPPGAKVYQDQLFDGQLLGFSYDRDTRQITDVRDGSIADRAGIQVGARLNEFAEDRSVFANASRAIPAEDVLPGVIATVDGRRYRWTPDELPPKALPVAPAQLISSFGALVLCLALCGLSLANLRAGAVMIAGFASYAVLRFIMELIRVDEAGQFGTSLSISQWVSLFVFAFSIVGLVWIYRGTSSAALHSEASPNG
ncbi:Prolipoprotein diacylglyceryl transferase [Rubripirellula tenax]|uniref:Phosphatidylglycerol--prolipoprotein diacylglyceryl transferase n=1 Tax=Rubripirellula tenax TaxID=2528015 RepID=A0A5C6EBW4_9BACT|nr:prolipoprotein diacylglyceryl transferase [Rubripirellula tenax]TWU46220.1 Prolipoprotein diacylglyceryl transferase [Rubripirellula tenax]